MPKIQYNPTETQLVELVKNKLANEDIQYIRKYSHKLKNFTDRRNHKFWAISGTNGNIEILVKLVEELNKETNKISSDYKVVLHIYENYGDVSWIKIVYKHKK